MLDLARKLYRNHKGGTAIEYGLICALIVLAMIGAYAKLANTTTTMWNEVGNKVEASTPD